MKVNSMLGGMILGGASVIAGVQLGSTFNNIYWPKIEVDVGSKFKKAVQIGRAGPSDYCGAYGNFGDELAKFLENESQGKSGFIAITEGECEQILKERETVRAITSP